MAAVLVQIPVESRDIFHDYVANIAETIETFEIFPAVLAQIPVESRNNIYVSIRNYYLYSTCVAGRTRNELAAMLA